MKNLLCLSVILLSCSLTGLAQTEAGKIMLGTSTTLFSTNSITGRNVATLSFTSTKTKADNFETDNQTSSNFNLSPKVGIFISEAFLVGADVAFFRLDSELQDNATVSIEAGPFVRYYLSANATKPFLQAGLGVGQIKYTDVNKVNLFSYNAGGGVAFFLNDRVSLDLMAAYLRSRIKDEDALNNARDIIGTVAFAFGFSAFF